MDEISLLIHQLEEAKTRDEINILIEKLSQMGETVIRRLQDEYLYTFPLRKGKRIIVLEIYQQMGYPTNKTAIPYMVSIVSDINSPGWELACQELVKIGLPTVPAIRESLKLYSDNYAETDTEYQGLCALIKEMGVPIINLLAPDLHKLIEEGSKNVRAYVKEVLEIVHEG